MNEINMNNKKMKKNFDVTQSLLYQIPHFACKNVFLNQAYQKDVARYVLSSEHNIPAYKGSYGDQPSSWVQKIFIISSTINQLQKDESLKIQNQAKGKVS